MSISEPVNRNKERLNWNNNARQVERITWNSKPLTYVIRAGITPGQTTFFTPPEFKQQVSYIVYPASGEIPRHVHRDLERHLVGTSEVLMVLRGRCEMDVYCSISF